MQLSRPAEVRTKSLCATRNLWQATRILSRSCTITWREAAPGGHLVKFGTPGSPMASSSSRWLLRSRIPLALIEALERGELSRWPRALYGRTQLVRYARAAGLDPDWVVNAVMPLLEEPASADALPEPEPASGSDGRIAIIASTFDKDEELFAPEDGGPQTAAPAGQRATVTWPSVARTPQGPSSVSVTAAVQPSVSARPLLAPRPRRSLQTRANGPLRGRSSRTTVTALAIGAALLCGAALWSYTPRPSPDDVHARRTPGGCDFRHDRAHRAPGDRDVRGCARGPGNAAAVSASRGTSGARHRELGSTDSPGSCRCEDRSSIQAAGSAARSNRCSRRHSGGGPGSVAGTQPG